MPARSEPGSAGVSRVRSKSGTGVSPVAVPRRSASPPKDAASASHVAERRGTATVGLIGARGHTGAELLQLIAQHPRLSLAFASSRQLAGQSIPVDLQKDDGGNTFLNLAPSDLTSHAADIYVLALPNDASFEYITSIEASCPGESPLIIDLSADHRFDDDWTYGLPEINAAAIATSSRIANPGCYATAMMLALAPLAGQLDGPPHCFGVSGYSGAGSTPSPRNDVEQLRDNLMPYKLADHIHEREVSRHLGRDVHFMPHVASFFRGISMTVSARLRDPITSEDLAALFRMFYDRQPFVQIDDAEAPLPRDAVGTHRCTIGGFTVSERDLRDIRIVSTLDNLLKGAASQTVQNINLARGWDMTEGLMS